MNPCITCTKQGGTEKKMMPIMDEHEPAFFERPFRTQATNAPRGSGRERHFSSMLWRQRRLERFPSSILHFSGGSKGTAVPEQIRAALVEHSAAPGHARAAISSQLQRWAKLVRPFREPAAAPGQARAAISSQLRFRARLEVGNLDRCGVFEQGQCRESSKSVRKSERRSKL